ncbi:MAG: RibD family protein [Bdellovibrionales bacterium]|nr:RibD family protein [Bdellovibrionales bacterium]
MKKPHITLKCAISLDGYLDDNSTSRLLLSSEEDLRAVDQLRAGSDAILVGAGTIRSDDPSLCVKDVSLLKGKSQPLRVAVSRSLTLPPNARFFSTDSQKPILYTPAEHIETATSNFGALAECVSCGQLLIDWGGLFENLANRGVKQLLIEAGASLSSQLIPLKHFDRVRLAIAPYVLGQTGGARFCESVSKQVSDLKLVESEQLGNTQVLWLQ